ncbi:MAG: hypothetical protein ACOYK8_06515 [Alphaproteobacteria bacterium]
MSNQTPTQILCSYLPFYMHEKDVVQGFEQTHTLEEQRHFLAAIHASYMKDLANLATHMYLVDDSLSKYFNAKSRFKKNRNELYTQLCESCSLPADTVIFFNKNTTLVENVIFYMQYTSQAVIQQFEEVFNNWNSARSALATDHWRVIAQQSFLPVAEEKTVLGQIKYYSHTQSSPIISVVEEMNAEDQQHVANILHYSYMLELARLFNSNIGQFSTQYMEMGKARSCTILDTIEDLVLIPSHTVQMLNQKPDKGVAIANAAFQLMQTTRIAVQHHHGAHYIITKKIATALEAEDQLTQRFSLNQAQKLLKSLPPNNNKNLPPSPLLI